MILFVVAGVGNAIQQLLLLLPSCMATQLFPCDHCSLLFEKEVKLYNHNVKRGSPNWCKDCRKPKTIELACEQCSKVFQKKPSQVRKTKHHYCSQSCAAFWRNAHKSTGTQRSKMEFFLEEKLKAVFPEVSCLYNDVSAIGAELDFYFPEIRLAIELNGIVHYEPIYGKGTFERTQNRDKQKLLFCCEAGIELIIVPNLGNFSKRTSEMMWEIIKAIISSRT